jgi:hypothetical protein
LSFLKPLSWHALGVAVLLAFPAIGGCGQSAVYLHPVNLGAGLVSGYTWIAVTGEWAIVPRLSLVVTPAYSHREFTTTSMRSDGGLDENLSTRTHLGIYLGPRFYMDASERFYTQICLAYHEFEDEEDFGTDYFQHSNVAASALFYLGWKYPGKYLAFSADAGIGNIVGDYEKFWSDENREDPDYLSGLGFDINLCIGFGFGSGT